MSINTFKDDDLLLLHVLNISYFYWKPEKLFLFENISCYNYF